jgi:hypothetical protein
MGRIKAIIDMVRDIESWADDIERECSDLMVEINSLANSEVEFPLDVENHATRLINYMHDPSDYNWANMFLSNDYTRRSLSVVWVKDKIMYGSCGRILAYCKTNLDDGAYFEEKKLEDHNLNMPNFPVVIKNTEKYDGSLIDSESIKEKDGYVILDGFNIMKDKFKKCIAKNSTFNLFSSRSSVMMNPLRIEFIGSERKIILMPVRG